MLPVSGAEQLKTSGAIGERPMISQRGAYSVLVSPAPRSLSGRKRFQRPRSRAVAFNSSMIGGTCQRVGPAHLGTDPLARRRLQLVHDRGNLPAGRSRGELVVEDLLVRVD